MARNYLKDLFDDIHFIKAEAPQKAFAKELSQDGAVAEFIRKRREEVKRINDYKVDPLSVPITKEWRHAINELGEFGYDYIIIKDDGQTDNDLEEFCEDTICYPPITGPYDCTGKRFTSGLYWNRVPVGIVIIHTWSLDI